MTIPIGTISNSQYSLRWRQPYVSESLNRKVGLVARGIVQGFRLEVLGANSQIRIAPDAINGISLAQLVGRAAGNQFTLTLRLAGNQDIDLAPFLAAGDTDQDFALVIRPVYTIGSPTTVGWELVRPADFTDALLNDVLVVGFLRTDPISIANPLQEVFVAGSAQSRGVTSQGWARQSLMADYAKMGAPTGLNDGQVLELLYDSGDADMDRWREYLAAYGPQGIVSTQNFGGIASEDRADLYTLRLASPMFPIAQGAGSGSAFPDQALFAFGYINIDEGPTADGYELGSVRVGGYDATWWNQPTPISLGVPLVCSSPLYNWYPCKPGDQFVVQMWIKSGGADTIYPPSPADPLIMQGSMESGLGAFWGGPSREFLDQIVQTDGVTLGSEEVHTLDPDQGATFVHSKNWTLYRETFTCPPDYNNTPVEYQAPRWFAPFWKFSFADQGHLLIAGFKVWKVRNGRATGHYDEYRLSHTADANPIGEAGRSPAQQPGRFGSALALNPQGTKVLDAGAAAQDQYDVVPWILTQRYPNQWTEIFGHSPNVPAYAAVPPRHTTESAFSPAAAPSVGAPTYRLELLSIQQTLRQWNDTTLWLDTGDAPGIWEHLLTGGMVLRAQPDFVTNAQSDVRFCLGDPPNPAGTWSFYDFPISPRWCVREDGSSESNAHANPLQGAQLQASSDWGAKNRNYRTSDPPMLGLLGQRVATANLLGDDCGWAFCFANNRYKGWEAARDEFTASFHSPWSTLGAPLAEYHIDLMQGYGGLNSAIGRPSDSGPYTLPRALSLWSLAAVDTLYPGIGGGTVLELVHDEYGPDNELEDGQSVAWLGRMLADGGGGPWPFVAGGLVLRRGGTTQTLGPTGFRGDAVLSLYNSKAGFLASHFAIDPFGCAHFSLGPSLDGFPYSAGPLEPFQYRPGGDALASFNGALGKLAPAIFNYMPVIPMSGFLNVRCDPAGRIYGDPTTFTEFHYYSPAAGWVATPEGDALVLIDDGGVEKVVRSTTAQATNVVGIFAAKGPMKNTQNSVTGELVTDYWWDPVNQRVIDWSTYVYDPEHPPELVRPDEQVWPEMVQVAAVGDNRVFFGDGVQVAGFNVVDEGGDIAIGDLLETSTIPGKLRKQADGIVRNATVGKALQAVSFSGGAPSPSYGIYGVLMCG